MPDTPLFTDHEIALLADDTFFPHKAVITQKLRNLLEQLREAFHTPLQDAHLLAPAGFSLESYQFVKGEHLEHFPYQYLDFPRFYTQEEKFAIRSLIWWGHHVVFSLIVEGGHIRQYKENVINRFGQIADRGIHLYLGSSLWEWKHGPGLTFDITRDRKSQVAAILAHRSFFKLGVFLPFDAQHLSESHFLQAGTQALQAYLSIIAR